MTAAAAKTGIGPTLMVAVEQGFPPAQRLIHDELALRILPFGMRAFARMAQSEWMRHGMIRAAERRGPGLWAGILCRKRYIDDRLCAAAGRIQAVVNLGAGFDTRLYRLPGLEAVPAWEVDQPQNVAPKVARLKRIFGRVPRHVTVVAVDLERESLDEALGRAGFSRDLRAFYIWEAVTQYLTAEGVEATLAFLARAAAGSELALTYVRRSFLDGRELYGQQAVYEKYVVKQRSWRFGLEPESLGELLARHGWDLVEHLGYEELAQRYVAPTGRALASTPLERIAHARKR